MSLTLAFYKRNLVEGLFLSSGIVRNADYTMEQVVRVARELRERHGFLGYIHLKTIPEASPSLVEEAGRHADRISLNIELPREESLRRLAPEKSLRRAEAAMDGIRRRIDEAKAMRAERRGRLSKRGPEIYATGQSTQMIVGADDSDDAAFLRRADGLYRRQGLRRVYYSAFSPIPSSSSLLPSQAPPLLREHRLYQADWLLRFYGFEVGELTPESGADTGRLDLAIDPKLAWALRHREVFPVDLNRAPRERLLRVPGLGVRNVERLLSSRRLSRIRLADLVRLRVALDKCLPFVIVADHHPARHGLDGERLRERFLPPAEQLEFAFGTEMSSSTARREPTGRARRDP